MAHQFRTTLFVFSHGAHLYSVEKAENKLTKPLSPPTFHLVREDRKGLQIDAPVAHAIRKGIEKLEIPPAEPPMESCDDPPPESDDEEDLPVEPLTDEETG